MSAVWGTRAWFEREFQQAGEAGDPWGHEWRGSQQLRYRRLLSLIAPLLGQSRPRVLDAGCSYGELTGQVAKANPGSRVLGLDLSPRALRVASRRLPLRDAAFAAGALPDCPFAPESFDLVIAAETLYYLPAAQRAAGVAAIWRLLRPGGHLIFSSVLDDGRRYFTPGSARALLEPCFQIEQVEYGHDGWFARWERPCLRLERRLSRGLQLLSDEAEYEAWQSGHAGAARVGGLGRLRRSGPAKRAALFWLRLARALVRWMLGWRWPVYGLAYAARAAGRGVSEVIILAQRRA